MNAMLTVRPLPVIGDDACPSRKLSLGEVVTLDDNAYKVTAELKAVRGEGLPVKGAARFTLQLQGNEGEGKLLVSAYVCELHRGLIFLEDTYLNIYSHCGPTPL